MPRVSVIIPAYNSEREIEESLRSVHAQTYGDWEAVVGDDASTDRTAQAAEEFGERVRVIRGERNLGPAATRNRAIEAGTGELLAFLDADDRWLPDYLTEQVALYESRERQERGVGIVACDALILGPEGFAPGTLRERLPFPSPLTTSKLLAGNPIFISGALVPRSAVEQAGGFSTECFGTEDYDLWIRLLELGYRVVANPRALTVYRVSAGSVSADVAGMARNRQTVYRRALERGRLRGRERRVARRELRLQRLLEKLARIRDQRAEGAGSLAKFAAAAPLAVAVAAENPRRWPRVARDLWRGRLVPDRDVALR